ncbi:MAG: hypothetical protein ABR555_13775 [Pyrinomonadaceae bacterium]
MKAFRKFPAIQSHAAMLTIQLLVGVVVIGIIFWKLQFSTTAICCGDYDGYYHIKWSQMLWESIRNKNFPPRFNWLPLTTLNARDYVDHHLLFHFLQIPFTWFRDIRLGVKVASTIFASLAVISCYCVILRYRIRYPLVWLLALLACSSPFLFRLNMAKAPPLAIIFTIVGIHLLFTRRYWLLVPLAFVFTLAYDMFLLLFVAVCIWVMVVGWTERKFEWRPLAWVVLGIAGGLIINPYFPRNLQLLYEHATTKITPADFSTKVGSEWYPYNSWEFLGNSLVACAAMVTGYIAFDTSDRKRSQYPLFVLIFSTVLLVMTARWKRIAEYWPPFAVLFAAFTLHPWLTGARSVFTHLPSDVLLELQPFLDRDITIGESNGNYRELLQTIGVAVVAVALGTVLFFNLRVTSGDIRASSPHEFYKNGATWLRNNVPPQQMIFNTDWDDFPRLFYYDPSHWYVTGLDPGYLFDKNPDLSEIYDRITLGEEEDPGPLIRDRFGARYVFSDNSHHDFFMNAQDSGWFEIVYEDKDCTIMHIRDEKVVSRDESNVSKEMPTGPILK